MGRSRPIGETMAPGGRGVATRADLRTLEGACPHVPEIFGEISRAAIGAEHWDVIASSLGSMIGVAKGCGPLLTPSN